MRLCLFNLQKDEDMLKGMELIYNNMDVSDKHQINAHDLKVRFLMENTVTIYK